jgi:nicotinamide mononucleotide (NMN) deamidase PncC
VDDETLAAVRSVKNMTNQLIGASSASLTAKIAMANAGASGGGGSTQSINMGGVTIVRPPETPGQAYRALQRTGRQMIRQFGR